MSTQRRQERVARDAARVLLQRGTALDVSDLQAWQRTHHLNDADAARVFESAVDERIRRFTEKHLAAGVSPRVVMTELRRLERDIDCALARGDV